MRVYDGDMKRWSAPRAAFRPTARPRGTGILERDQRFMSRRTRAFIRWSWPAASGAVIEDVDGNRFLDFTAGIAVTAAGHCHPAVTGAGPGPGGELIHMSRTGLLL